MISPVIYNIVFFSAGISIQVEICVGFVPALDKQQYNFRMFNSDFGTNSLVEVVSQRYSE